MREKSWIITKRVNMWLTVDPNSINAVNILNKIQTNPTFLLNLILFLSMLDIYVQNDKGKRSK